MFLFFQELKRYQQLSGDLERRVSHQGGEVQALTDERSRLLREIAQLRASSASSSGQQQQVSLSSATGVAHLRVASSAAAVANPALSPGEAALRSVGSFKLYELALAVLFVLFMVNWNLF